MELRVDIRIKPFPKIHYTTFCAFDKVKKNVLGPYQKIDQSQSLTHTLQQLWALKALISRHDFSEAPFVPHNRNLQNYMYTVLYIMLVLELSRF